MSTALWDLPAEDRRKVVPYPFEERRQQIEAEIASLKGEISDLGCEIAGLRDRIWEAEDEQDNARRRLETLKTELANL